jgi:1L-myo-inositol 1-phosphate cytidylyltransferase / CDP-L-myo-inositol myo-inositolphosphotransferase
MQQQPSAEPSDQAVGLPSQANAANVEHAVIIAAGSGARFGKATHLCPKPMLEVLGIPLILRTIYTAQKAGICHFTVVTGYHAEMLETFLEKQVFRKISVRCVRNDKWQRPNGLSALAAAGEVPEQFVLLMADHLFEAEILRKMLARPLATGHCRLAVDYRIRNVLDLEDATKVMVEDGYVTDIGKQLPSFNAIDTGIFLCSSAIFDALETSVARGRETLSDGIRELAGRGAMEVEDCGDRFWQDVDNEHDLEVGEERLLATLVSKTDSWLTRTINRRISLAVTRRLAWKHIKPNQITIFNFALGLTGAACMLVGDYWGPLLGSLLFLLSSILDGCDGEIARLKFQQTRVGAWLDVSTDNVTHLALFLCTTIGLMRASGAALYALPGGLLVVGALSSFVLSIIGHRLLDRDQGPIFSSSRLQDVHPSEDQSRLALWLDRLANRDFAYLIVFLALIGRVGWFLWIAGLGAPVFGLLLYRAITASNGSRFTDGEVPQHS